MDLKWVINQPVHEDVSVITEWFLAEETSIQEMGLVVLLEPGVTEPPRSRRKRRRRRKRSHGGRNVTEAAIPPRETHRPWKKGVVGPGKAGFHISQRGQPIVLVDETRPPCNAGNWFHFLWSSDDLSAGMRLAGERMKRRNGERCGSWGEGGVLLKRELVWEEREV